MPAVYTTCQWAKTCIHNEIHLFTVLSDLAGPHTQLATHTTRMLVSLSALLIWKYSVSRIHHVYSSSQKMSIKCDSKKSKG